MRRQVRYTATAAANGGTVLVSVLDDGSWAVAWPTFHLEASTDEIKADLARQRRVAKQKLVELEAVYEAVCQEES